MKTLKVCNWRGKASRHQGRPCCKTTTREQEAFCTLRFAKTNSVTVAVLHQFRNWSTSWKDHLQSVPKVWRTCCICNGKSTRRPHVWEGSVDWIRETFQGSQRKLAYRGSRPLWLPETTVWRILRRRRSVKCYSCYNPKTWWRNQTGRVSSACRCKMTNLQHAWSSVIEQHFIKRKFECP